VLKQGFIKGLWGFLFRKSQVSKKESASSAATSYRRTKPAAKKTRRLRSSGLKNRPITPITPAAESGNLKKKENNDRSGAYARRTRRK
jgi:hypothetical protein